MLLAGVFSLQLGLSLALKFTSLATRHRLIAHPHPTFYGLMSFKYHWYQRYHTLVTLARQLN